MTIRTVLAAGTAAVVLAACGGNRDAGSTADSAATAVGTAAEGAGSAVAAGADTAAGRMGAAMGGDSAAGAMGGAAGGSLSDPSTQAQLDSVATAARSGLTSLPPATAVSLIQSIETKLEGTNNPQLTSIADDLEDLREELNTPGGGQISGSDVAGILSRLGPKVTAVAGSAGPLSETVRSIGQQLTSAATQLRGGAR